MGKNEEYDDTDMTVEIELIDGKKSPAPLSQYLR